MDRKEAIRQYKELKIPQGIFAVRCRPTGAAWVDASRNLTASKNRTWAELRMGGHRDKPLQAEWNAHGEAAFDFEILETLEEDVSAILLPDLLKGRKAHWVAQLQAHCIT
jgi:hypothetical protein